MKKLLSILLCAVIAVSASSLSAGAKSGKLKAPKLKSVSVTNTNTLKITWSKISKAKGYILYRKTSVSKFKKIASVKKTSYTNKKLKKNTKYFYKVKAYKTKGGKKIYSKFSNIKSKKSIVVYTAENMYKKSVKDILKIMGNKFNVKKGGIETFYYFYNYKKLPGMDFYFNVDFNNTTPVKDIVKSGNFKIEGIEVSGKGAGLRHKNKIIKANYDYKKCSKILGKFTCVPSSGALLSGSVGAVGYTINKSGYKIIIHFKISNNRIIQLMSSGTKSIPYSQMIKDNPKIKSIVVNKRYY